jgi:Fe2+ or Zn2+ uptake regulation protein
MEAQTIDAHELVANRLREVGQFYTRGRRDLVELLVRVGRPTTIPELLQSQPKLVQSSLYRNLSDLESVGAVQRVVGADELTRYEFSEDILGHHHHTICGACGAIDDFVLPAEVEQALEQALGATLADAGFDASAHRLDVAGICAECL